MADFRRWILAFAVLALVFTFTGVASAQAASAGWARPLHAKPALPYPHNYELKVTRSWLVTSR